MAVEQKTVVPVDSRIRQQYEGTPTLLSVCEDIGCPQQSVCLIQGLSVFHIMGNSCTRHCSFCGIGEINVFPIDHDEPVNIAKAVKRLNSKHIVLTSFTRDDLPEGGANHLSKTVKAVHEINPGTSVEVVLHSCPASSSVLDIILESAPEVVTHNVKTVPRLNSRLFENADYSLSIKLLDKIKKHNLDVVTKSGLMVGLGETEYEVIGVISDLHDVGCNCITFNQYLPRSKQQCQPDRYVTPWELQEYNCISKQMGYASVRAIPFSCGSYDALSMYREIAE